MRGLKQVFPALGIGLVVAACGGQSQGQRTAQTGRCLAAAIFEHQAHYGAGCDQHIKWGVFSQTKISASCTHQNGNQYICKVTGGKSTISGQPLIYDGFYNVTNDGQSIVYRASGG